MSREIAEYLAKHLTVQVENETEFGPVEHIKVKLILGSEVISEDYCQLPNHTDEN